MERVTGASIHNWYINISHWLKCTSPAAICVYSDKGSGVCKVSNIVLKSTPTHAHIQLLGLPMAVFWYLNINETWAAKGTHVSLNTNLCIIKTNKNPLEWVCLYLIVMCLANSLDLVDCRQTFCSSRFLHELILNTE